MLNGNVAKMYPLSAKQYVSGGWVEKTTKIYKNSAWVDLWDGTLYKNGDQYTGVTGGFITNKVYVGPSGGNNKTGVTFNTNSITINAGADASIVSTVKKISLTNYHYIVVSVSEINKIAYVSIMANDTGNVYSERVAGVEYKSNGNMILDISNITGDYYVVIWSHNNSGFTFNEVKLLR